MAGAVVTHIFPKYYLISYVCGAVAVVTSLVSWFTGTHSGTASYLSRVVILAIMLGLAIIAGAVIRPQALEIRTEMRSLVEESPKHGELQNRFNKLHKTSVFLNSAVFLLGIAIVFITAYNIRE
jgi:H+/Cl- antiporter ClcA